ncbi:hypothetical protein K3725_00550 [Leisingera sp. S132]|uniref:hypothetical protein n=1 Tax=Leisingera sp. S132 TaxID=2867016 RepID=UPI0021A38C8D|nr:hypothetical protein [Leisingera sp. S132]UWQ79532.1 hypothetical protein K3725_00550 [Leisingera sp. S132]
MKKINIQKSEIETRPAGSPRQMKVSGGRTGVLCRISRQPARARIPRGAFGANPEAEHNRLLRLTAPPCRRGASGKRKTIRKDPADAESGDGLPYAPAGDLKRIKPAPETRSAQHLSWVESSAISVINGAAGEN